VTSGMSCQSGGPTECWTRCTSGFTGHLVCGGDGAWVAGLGLFPCSSDGGAPSDAASGSVAHELTNQGTLCVYPASETMTVPGFMDNIVRAYVADQPVKVAVRFPVCLSTSCSRQPMAACTVDASNGTLQVTSKGSYVELDHSNGCTGDCGFLIARCTTASLAAGNYTFKHGTDTLAFTVPFTGPAPCVGGP
jgi:hypothetical protein